jgi:hypothetical protein
MELCIGSGINAQAHTARDITTEAVSSQRCQDEIKSRQEHQGK